MLKKILVSTLIGVFSFNMTSVSAITAEEKIQHLQGVTEAKTDLVRVENGKNTLLKDNRLQIAFSDNFNSKYYREGDLVQFVFMRDVRTEEGTTVIPCGTNVLAKVRCIEKPKWFSRNAIVDLEFDRLIYSDGTVVPLQAQVVSNSGYLKKGPGDTAKKIIGQTLAIGAVGTGLGAAIGVAAGHTITGVIIGGSVGGGVGLLTGIISPGLYFKAKQGTCVYIELCDSLVLPQVEYRIYPSNQCVTPCEQPECKNCP